MAALVAAEVPNNRKLTRASQQPSWPRAQRTQAMWHKSEIDLVQKNQLGRQGRGV